jgi:hypothetical protein
MRRLWQTLLGFLIGAATTAVLAQPFPAPVQLAVTQLTTGVTPFTDLGVVANGYINFGVTRGTTGYGIRDNAGALQFKNSGGSWLSAGGGDLTATYILQVADGGLSNAQVLGALASALLVNTTTTGVLSAYAGSTCTNQFVRALSALGAATCTSVSLSLDTSGTLPASRGGTNVDSSAWSALPLVTAGAWAPYAGTTCTNQAVTALSALGVATCTALTSAYVNNSIATTGVDINTSNQVTATHLAAGLPAIQGGTGQILYTVGDILYASTTTALSKLSTSGTGNLLRSLGAATAPAWSVQTFPNSSTQGDLFVATAANTMGSLVDVTAGSFLRSGGAGVLPAYSTTTWPNAATTGDLMVATGTNAIGSVADVAVGSFLKSGGVSLVPVWSTSFPTLNLTSSYQFNANVVTPPIVLTNTAVLGPIVSTNTETYFLANSPIPAGVLNGAGHRIALVLRGVYGVNGATDTIVLRVKLCTISGCGSGTVAVLAATAAVTPGAATATQGWQAQVDANVYSGGATAALDAQGFAQFALTSTTASPAITMPNTATVAVDTTVIEYIAVSAQFNNNSASNTIALRNYAAYVY